MSVTSAGKLIQNAKLMPNKPRKYWKVREEKHIFIVPGLSLAQANR